jgi:hypothetical protein
MSERATLILSFDVELGWGAVENDTWRLKEEEGLFERTRPAVSSLLHLLEETEIPVSRSFPTIPRATG